MGQVELNKHLHQLTIYSTFYFYGDAGTQELSLQIANDISHHWNEPKAIVNIGNREYEVRFDVKGIFEPDLQPETVWYNDDPRLNFFRIEEYVMGNISFVDGLGCNTGYFKLDNLLQTSTTAAHEYGHTIGLEHPTELDIRGRKAPGIMYPRGTICDPHLQYDPTAAPSAYGGFLNPTHRRVLQSDIDALKLHKLLFDERGMATLGSFSSMYHSKHIAA